MDRGGLSGDDGPTHHGLFDISYLRGIPNIVHMVPRDEDALADMMYTALLHDGPSAIRYPRGVGPGVTVKAKPTAIPIGKAEVLREGYDVAVFALGAMMHEGERLADMLEAQGLSVALIDPRFAKPIDSACVRLYGTRCRLLITLEDHVLAGGFGSALLECVNDLDLSVPVVRVGWPDAFIEHGKVESLRAKYGLTAEGAMEKAAPHLRPLVESLRVAVR
jgi:1-deoxy-D-xylulose-5-phosphate synthase